ncbi:MAG: LpxL/LpxP family Kdo(2)-lipid IV(A) lauroyl/palmitoleoyl acyltransferase [Thiohalomonadales bacterium]
MSTQEKSLPPGQLGTKFGLICLRLLVRLPYPLLISIGRALGQLSYWFMHRRCEIASTNIKLCFPELSQRQRSDLVRESFHSVGISLFETAMSWWASDEKLAALCHIEGLENLRDAERQQRGILLLSGHFTSTEISGRLLSSYTQLAFMYKPNRNRVLNTVITNARENRYGSAISQDDLRGFIRALKNKLTCWYAPDQDLGISRGVFAPFFGIPAATITAPSRFAKIANALVVPYSVSRRRDNKGYDLKILPALKNFPSNDPVADATLVNKIIENQIRESPGQYLWQHRRFKTRPPGEESLYER